MQHLTHLSQTLRACHSLAMCQMFCFQFVSIHCPSFCVYEKPISKDKIRSQLMTLPATDEAKTKARRQREENRGNTRGTKSLFFRRRSPFCSNANVVYDLRSLLLLAPVNLLLCCVLI